MTKNINLIYPVVIGLIVFAGLFPENSHASTLTSSSRGEDLRRINQLKSDVDNLLFKGPPEAFYNYSLICGGKEYESRGDRSFVDKTVPEKYRKLIAETFLSPESRANKCPKWSNNFETSPKSGSMDVISIPENTRVGEKVYFLLAMDPEQQPVYYFMRKAETEVENNPNEPADDIIFRVNVIKMGYTWIGEVILDKKLDFETKKSYNYLTYAYDGFNLLEKYSLIEVTDVDDESPTVEKKGNTGWNSNMNQFEFSVFENASVGEIINPGRNIIFNDIDTQNSQLNIRLVNLETGMADSPFNLNNLGELRLTSKLDHESHKEYLLKIRVHDLGGQFAEELIRIEIMDVPDLPPRFVLPRLVQDPNLNGGVAQSLGYLEFYENTLGRVFDIRAESQNQQPLGKITYRLERVQSRQYSQGYFELSFNRTSMNWYLECVKKIDLNDRDVDVIEVVIRAIESSSNTGPKLITDLRVNLRIVNGDLCAPKFNKELYEFKVLEGVRQLLEPIFVEDCDHGVNGRIFLSTTRDNEFSFKIEQVYRFSKLGIQMQRTFDYEDETLYEKGHDIEFEIIASSSNRSLNQYSSRSKVRVRILDKNEFAPRFVLPPPAIILKDGQPTVHTQRVFTYNVPENRDYSLDIKAVDDDDDGTNELFYNIRYLHPEDTFETRTSLNSSSGIFTVTIPGRFLDANSPIPIVFGVYAEDIGEPKLRNEIIVYLRPQSVDLKPPYFEFERYEYRMIENDPKPKPFELRVINDNLGSNGVLIREIHDPLNLMTFDFAENLVTEGDLVSFTLNDVNRIDVQSFPEFTNDLLVYLYRSASKRDFDQVFIENNRSDVYEYKLRASLKNDSSLFTDVSVFIKLIDSNDNPPRLVGQSPTGVTILDATLPEDFIPNTLLNINSNYSVLKFTDADFSPEFGLPSLYCRLNDTRFYIETEFMMNELQTNASTDRLTVPIRVASSGVHISYLEEPVIWLNISCEDNSFARKITPFHNYNPPVIIRIRVLEQDGLVSLAKTGREWFDREQFVFMVDEDKVGVVGQLATVISKAAETLNLRVEYSIEGPKGIEKKLKVNPSGELEVLSGFDFENSERLFNFTVAVHLSNDRDITKKVEFRTSVTLIVNDLNDERPRFTQSSYEFVLNANRPSTSPNKTEIEIGSIFAVDLDKEDEKNLKLELTGSDATQFTFEKREFGEFVLVMPVELMTDKSKYEFQVRVSDLKGQSAEADVSVRVESRSLFDELRWSQEETYTSSIEENSQPGTQLIGVKVLPVGLISGAKFNIGYKLAEVNPYYQIDESTGVVTTGNVPLDREETNAFKQMQQTRVYVQAYMDLNGVRYWSTTKQINVQVLDENDERPSFMQPTNNNTQIAIHVNRFESIFNFSAVDNDLNDRVTYSLVEQRLVFSNGTLLSLPFKLNPRNGTLSFVPKELTQEDFRDLIKHGANIAKIRLTVRAIDKSSKSSAVLLFVNLPVNELIKSERKTATASVQNRIPIAYDLKLKSPEVEKTKDRVFTINETLTPDTVIGDIRIFLEGDENNQDESKPELFDTLKLVSSPDEPSYFSYNSSDFSLKLARPLDYDLVKNLTVSLRGGGLVDSNLKIDLNFLVRDVNNKPPELKIDREERDKYGSNLILVVADDLSDIIETTVKAISSTPPTPRPPLPSIPELSLPERVFPQPPYQTPELDSRRSALTAFNDQRVVKRYEIIDPDLSNNFTIRIVNETGDFSSTARPISARIDGNKLLIEKTGAPVTMKSSLVLELSDGVNVKNYTGEIFPVFAKQLQRFLTYLPENGRFQGNIYRSSVGSVRIDLDPMIQIENQFPYDISLNLTGTHAKFFQITPRVVRSSPINISPAQVDLSLRSSLDKNGDEFAYVTMIELDVTMSTENEYLNDLLKAFGPIKIKLNVKSENKYKPEILSFSPPSGKIFLDEGTYTKEQVASIEGFDRDRFDPGRLEYFLIGDSNLLEINRTTGLVYLTGTLDAEADQPHVFFCFARDMAPAPFGMNSNLIRFEIYVNNINEFAPMLLPAMTSITIVEPSSENATDQNIWVKDFRFDCSDRDVNSSLTISLDSVRYVNKFDINRLLESDNSYDIESLFELVYSNSSGRDYKSAYLTYSSRLDFEKLMTPTETYIRLDVSCSDGEFKSKSRVIVQIEDRNDNRPKFINKHLMVRRNESNLLQTLAKLDASDGDLSPEYGNYSLEYSIIECVPNIYGIYVDSRTGQVRSRLVIDLDTPEIIRQRGLMFESSNSSLNVDQLKSQIDFLSTFNRIKCEVKVSDNQLYKPSNSSISWHDTMSLEIVIDSVNDNAPEISLDQDNALIEVREGEATRSAILLQIPVFDKDDATGLVCLFGNGLATSDPFELKTVPQSPHQTVCVLKVRDDMIVDYDVIRKSFYLLELVVRDELPPPVYPNKGISRAQLRVRVIPVNNQPPLFVNGNEETFYVLDSIRPGTIIGTVLATDMENPNPDRLIYQIDKVMSEPTITDKFELKTSANTTQSYWGSAALFVKGKLEVSESPYFIPVVVYDGPPDLKDTLSSRKLFKVVVLNKGSMSVWVNATTGVPVDYYSVKLDEEVGADTLVCQVRANIPDNYQSGDLDPKRNKVEYSFVVDEADLENEIINKFYEIDRDTGRIITTGERIDYEQEETRRLARGLKVKAQTGDKFFTYFTHVVIDIVDINDNQPRFDPADNFKVVNVIENTTLTDHGVIGRVRATDADSGINGLFKYRLITNTTLFNIDETSGDIICVDGGLIDRETTPFYNLEIAAIDTGDLNSTIEITVAVLDINDNWPRFDLSDSGLDFQVEENEPLWSLRVNASDADQGQNASLLFYLDSSMNSIDSMQKFRIDPITGLIELISPLDYEVKTQHRLTILCTDQGTPEQLKSTLELIIDVVDVNDNGPKFTTPNGQRVRVVESITPGEVITRVTAQDADLTPEFNQIIYKLDETLDDSSLFTIGESSGEIRLAEDRRLNYDVKREYSLTVMALDAKKPVEFGDWLNFTIVVDPSNDKLPVFEQPKDSVTLFKRSLQETTPENDYVVEIIRAVDPNQRGIIYSIESVEAVENNETKPAPPNLFSIGPEDGVIKARSRRSAYSADSYRINIRATSKLNETLSNALSLVVNVDRMSDSLFDSRVYEKSIDENAPIGMFVLQLRPRVRVTGELVLRYDINRELSSPFGSWFQIDSHSGRIETASRDIDCEKADEILLTVNVTDWKTSIHIESLLVKIRINDLDDNLPIFEPNYIYEVKMEEDDNSTRRNERFITRFRAKDSDRSSRLSEIEYHLDTVSSRALSVDSFRLFVDEQTEEVSLFKLAGVLLDRDDPAIGNKIKLTITAENPFDKTKFTRKVIIVNLIDLNDNAPRIIDTESEISLPESYRLNQAFYHVKALDADEPGTPNSDLVYSLRPLSAKIQIDSNGYLSLITPLDYETEREVEINVEVFDKSNHPLTTTRAYFIRVTNVNDNPPRFIDVSADNCEFSVYEDAEIGHILHKFEAIDLDMPNSTDFIFDLDNERSLPFSIDSKSGELKTSGKLDREIVAEYKSVRVTVKDPEIAGKRLETTLVCSVRVLDVNDNKPVFAATSTKFTILPILSEKTLVGFFSASDADSGNNATIDFFLLNDFDGIYELDQTGHLFLNLRHHSSDKNLDLRDLYEITVVARDRGTPVPLESSLIIAVKIDPNYFNFNQAKNEKLDLEATFDLSYLNENTEPGYPIGQVRALNSFGSIVDEAASSASNFNRTVNLTFSLISAEDTFQIDPSNGSIRVLDSSKLDYERYKEFLLNIEAREVQRMSTYSKERIGKIRLIVKLQNVNDNPVRFNKDVFTVRCKESDPRQTLPFDIGLDPLIEISDPDLESGDETIFNQRNPIKVELTGIDANLFRLTNAAPTVYRIEARERFDFEIRSSYQFNVTADDGLYKSEARVIVDVIDVNDNKPLFERPEYSFRIDENSPTHTEVGRVRAIDLDATPENNLTLYKITNAFEMTVFGISERTGAIYVRDSSQLDREKSPTFNLTVVAYNPDAPELFDTTRVLVHLNDLNDQTPRFERSVYQISIREKWKKLPRLLGRLQATDLDLAENGTVSYGVESINGRPFTGPQPPFYVDKVNGFFYLNAYLDADVDIDGSPKSFEVRVVAQDKGGLRDKATVMITLIDVNDHPPVVIMPKSSEFFQDENSPVNSTSINMRCIDPDYKQVHVNYELERDLNRDFESFTLDSYGGVLSNLIEFDYEEKNEYRVRINCVDTGMMINFEDLEANRIDYSTGQMVNDLDHSYTHSLVTKLDLVIKIRDLDDNEPRFSDVDKHLAKNISEYLEPNSTVAIIPIAHDRDTLPENTQVRYIILPPTDGSSVLSKFALNETSGELTLRDELESSERSFYEIRVKATSRRDSIDMRPNDNDPSQITLQLFVVKDRLTVEFEQQNYQVSVKTDKKNDDDDDDDDNEEEDGKIEHAHKMVDLKRQTTRSVVLDESILPPGRQNTAIFFAKAHLIKRKLKRALKFNIEMVKLIKFNQNAIIKLSSSLLNRVNHTTGIAHQLTADHLFSIDEQTGKVYISQAAIKQGNYRVGDRLILTISVESRPLHSDDSDDLVENAICQLSVRLVERDFTIILPMARLPVERIFFEFLNPLRDSYLPRNFEINGVKIAVQDLLESTRVRSNLHYYLLVQVESLKPVDLELFSDLWKNYSSLNRYLAEFKSDIGLIEKQPESESRINERSVSDLYNFGDNSPFYSNWLFWLLVLTVALLMAILVAFLFCIGQNKKQRKQDDKPGIIIEYPPGVNPMYNDGVLTLNQQKHVSRPTKRRAPTLVLPVDADEHAENRNRSTRDNQRYFEEQEAELMVDDSDVE